MGRGSDWRRVRAHMNAAAGSVSTRQVNLHVRVRARRSAGCCSHDTIWSINSFGNRNKRQLVGLVAINWVSLAGDSEFVGD